MMIFKKKAQAATELAVFGAILIFVVGGIVRSAFEAGLGQNQNLKAMRWAMLQSLYGVRNINKSRVSSSVMVIEDRLSPDASKFGSTERIPMIHSGSATFSNTLFLPMDWMELQNIAVMDVIVNGDHFAFSTARFMAYDVQLVGADLDGKGGEVQVWDLTNDIKKSYPRAENWTEKCATVFFPGEIDPCTDKPAIDPSSGPNCTIPPPVKCPKKPPAPPAGCLPYPGHVVGCPLAYTLIPVNSAKFCDGSSPCSDSSPLTVDQRFDLNRNGPGDDPDITTLRGKMMWQWSAAKGLVGEAQLEINAKDGVYPSLDIDADRKEEVIYGINNDACAMSAVDPNIIKQPKLIHRDIGCANVPPVLYPEVAQRFFVVDFQEGDMDFTADDFDKLQAGKDFRNMGLQKDMSVYSETKDGTYLEIREGKAYVPGTGNLVRSVNKRDHVDIISRRFQLSKNTGRFCNPGVIQPIGGIPNGLFNPVEWCATNCFTDTTIQTTCYDTTTNMLYIRTRLQETRGHKWVTEK